MSRKNSIIIIFAIVLLILGGLLFMYFSSNKTPTVSSVTTQTSQNPFGGTSPNKITSTSTQADGSGQTTLTKNANKLIQIYKNPTSGSVFLKNKNNQNVLRFVDRAVGHTYEYLPEDQTGEAQRITNTTIPKIQETAWSNSGNDLVLRYLNNDTDNINSFSAKIVVSSSSVDSLGELTGQFLPSNIKQLAMNPAGDKIFGLVDKSDRSGTYGFTSNLSGGNKKTVLNSLISYWNISWPKENIITLTTKPNSTELGLLYFFNTQTYSMDRILGNIVGLSTVTNKDASLVAYSYSADNSSYLDAYDVVDRINKKLKLQTLADKCIWGNNNSKILYCAIPKIITPDNYPDAWYQGLESFSDNIWKINTETGEETYQIGFDEGFDIDAFDLKISLDDKYLSFSDKKDLSLWLLVL